MTSPLLDLDAVEARLREGHADVASDFRGVLAEAKRLRERVAAAELQCQPFVQPHKPGIVPLSDYASGWANGTRELAKAVLATLRGENGGDDE